MTHPVPFVDFGGEGPLLHFAHANAYPPRCYQYFLSLLTPHFHVVAIGQRPLWPYADPAELTDWRLLSEDMIRLFDEQGWRDVIGVGHSLGAVATMRTAVTRPDLFRALVLVEPVFLLPTLLEMAAAHPDAAYQMPLVQSALRRRNQFESREYAFDRWRRKPVFARWPDESLWDYVNCALIPNAENGGFRLAYPREWEARIYALPPQWVWDVLPQVTQPTLGIRGAETDTIAPEAWRLWQEKQPQAEFVEIAGAGHMLLMERPSAAAQTILDYLTAV
ncbi:MAG TPA: alpha/beta hydrolase [Anaerolineae bacterium]|nr:alpha/beta hydrolase [Anaerolineae bacterium]